MRGLQRFHSAASALLPCFNAHLDRDSVRYQNLSLLLGVALRKMFFELMMGLLPDLLREQEVNAARGMRALMACSLEKIRSELVAMEPARGRIEP
jgi:hypothetical protein